MDTNLREVKKIRTILLTDNLRFDKIGLPANFINRASLMRF